MKKRSRRRMPPPELQWEVDDEALAYYVAAARYGGRSLPESVREEMDRIDRAAKSDPLFAARLDSLQRRIEELDPKGATESFQRLTGQPLEYEPPPPRAIVARPRPPRNRRVRTRFFVPVSIAAVVVLSVVFLQGQRYDDLAALEPERSFQVDPIVLRGGESPSENDVRGHYGRARKLLEESHRRLIGIIPYRDEGSLQEAISELRAMRSATIPGSPANAAASYTLAKAHLALSQPDQALEALAEASAASGTYGTSADSLAALVRARTER